MFNQFIREGWGIQEYALGGAVLAERLPDRAKAFTSPPIAQVDVYTAQKIQWSKLNNLLSEGKKKEVQSGRTSRTGC
jgi:hypothetical protein